MAAHASSTQDHVAPQPGEQAYPRLLIVDDDGRLRRMLAQFLQGEGFAVGTAASGSEMWQNLNEAAPSLVVLDLGLPDQDGIDLARELRMRCGERLGIIILTGRSASEDRVVGFEAGADDYVAKPVPLRELLARIRAVLRRMRTASGEHWSELGQRDLALRELQHRMRNVLALVTAVVNLSARTHTDVAEFAAALRARLKALAAAQDRLAAEGPSFADLRELAADELKPYERQTLSIRMSGPEALLKEAPALLVGLIFHELATNAAKYGALSRHGGEVSVSWWIEDTPKGERFLLEWIERGGPPMEAPSRRGFGSVLIEESVRRGLGGEAVREFAPEGFRYRMNVPATTILHRPEPRPLDQHSCG
jgi:two-component sensor histidine kinase